MHRPAPGEAGPVGRRRRPDHHPHAAAARLGDRQLQGNPAHPHGGRARRREITVDTFPGTRCAAMCWPSRRPRAPQFALLPPDNATGNFTKVVQRDRGEDRRSTMPTAWPTGCVPGHVGGGQRRRPGRTAADGASAAPQAAPAPAILSAPPIAPATSIPWLGLVAVLHGHLHLDPERAAVDLRAGRYPRRGACRLRRGRVDHHRPDRGADADRAVRHLAGRRLRPAPGADRGRAGLRGHLAPDAVLARTCRRCWPCSSSAAWPRASSFR